MCGITGIYHVASSLPVQEQLVVCMANELSHRGPDELSRFVDGHVGFGFRRLSIIDVSNGHQPFFSNDGTVVMICNGEIYNYKELRAELIAKGYLFKTNCDVEVIVHLYCEYGISFVHRLNGQFAFAIYDKKNNTLLLARDQFGICPLFYTFFDGIFIFGSEVKAILKHPQVKKAVNPEALDQVFTFPGMVSPATMFKGVHSLAPGHYLKVEDGKTLLVQYWDLIYPEENDYPAKPESYYIDALEEHIYRSVQYRLNSDVPVGFYLSGGLDSSLIGAFMKAVRPQSSYPAFSIVFPSDGEMNESKYQRLVANHLQADTTEIIFDSHCVEKKLQQAIRASESPLKESYNTCSLALSETVNNQGIKVILSGEGADELFGGYVGYRFDKQRKPPAGVKEIEDILEDECRRQLWGDPDFFYEKNYYEFAQEKCSLYSKELREQYGAFDSVKNLVFNTGRIRNRHILHKRSYIDLKLRLGDHLIADHCDRVTMANSVEGRFPFLDIDLVEFIKTIPPDIKLNGLNEKYILKQLARKYLPATIIDRQKFGFIAPGSPSLLQSNSAWINDLLSYDRIKRQGFFDPGVVETLRKRYATPGFRLNLPYESDLLIVVITFNIFLDVFGMPDC